MKYIGCDFHPSFQQVVIFNKETGEVMERGCCTKTEKPGVFMNRYQDRWLESKPAATRSGRLSFALDTGRCRHRRNDRFWIELFGTANPPPETQRRRTFCRK
jgi:hypothetical protein